MPASRNGIAPRNLTGPAKTSGYRPSVLASPAWLGTGGFAIGSFTLQIVDDMRRDPMTSLALSYKKAPLFKAKFEVSASNANVDKYVTEGLERFWRKSLPVSLECMPYGYNGSEALMKEEDGFAKFDCLKPLHSRDVKPFTRGGKLAFVRVGHIVDANQTPMGVQDEHGFVDLLAATKDRPAEGYWSVYDATYSPWYGRPILIPSWWYWRLKTMPDGALENLHKYFYKYGYNGMVGRYPNEEYDDGSGPKHAQDFMRQLGEQVKAGAVICLPSERWEDGEYKYIFERYGGEAAGGTDSACIGYVDWLDKGIVRGILIPDEILTHSGPTGGYSRSQIAFLAFIIAAEQILNHQLEGFIDQILRPAVTLNFGEGEKFTIKPLPLLDDEEKPEPMNNGVQVPEGVPGATDAPPTGAPYRGPRGGQGIKDPATGEIQYGKQFSLTAQTEEEFEALARKVVEDLAAKRLSTGDQPQPQKPLHSVENHEESTAAEVHKHDKGFSVVLKDRDSGSSFPHIKIYPHDRYGDAVAHAHKIANVPIKMSQAAQGGQWITIGGHKDAEGKRHGGSPVYVVNGRIAKGHPGLAGKKIDALKEPAEEQTHRKEVNQSKDYARAIWAKNARKEGVHPQHLHQLAGEMLAHDKAFTEGKNDILREARKMSKDMGHADLRQIARRAGSGGDYDKVKGFDEIASTMHRRYPEHFGQDESQAEEKLFDMLSSPPQRMSEHDAYQQAFDHLKEHQRAAKEREEAAPFSSWDPDDHPRSEIGQFSEKDSTRIVGTESDAYKPPKAKTHIENAIGKVTAKYRTLEARYGRKGAIAIVGAMALLVATPIPGATFAPLAIAEAVKRLREAA